MVKQSKGRRATGGSRADVVSVSANGATRPFTAAVLLDHHDLPLSVLQINRSLYAVPEQST